MIPHWVLGFKEILSDYDDLEPDDILAALAFAARLIRVKRVGAVTMTGSRQKGRHARH